MITDISDSDVSDTSTWCGAVFVVVTYSQAEQTTCADVLNTNILEQYIMDEVMVSTVDGKTTLIIGLHFVLAQNVDVAIDDMCTGITLLWTVDVSGVFGWSPMQAYEDGVSNICP